MTQAPATPEQKLAVLLDFLSEGRIARIYLVTRPQKGNAPLIPERLYAEEVVSFDIGYAMPVPIPDLAVSLLGVSGTLSFNGRPFLVEVPMDCIFMVDSGSRRAAFPGYEPSGLFREDPEPSELFLEDPAPAAGAKVLSLDDASRRLRGRPLRRGTGSGVFPKPPAG